MLCEFVVKWRPSPDECSSSLRKFCGEVLAEMMGVKLRQQVCLRYADALTQIIILGVICFLLPGMFNALNGLGAVGKADATITDNANTALAVTFAVCSLLAGGLFNLVGHRVLLFFGGLTYILYIGSYLSYNPAFVITAGAVLGVGAGFLWTAQGAIMMSYPDEQNKGLYISIFWGIFNCGAIIGSLISVSLEWHNAVSHVSNHTYISFMAIMAVGTLLTLLLLHPSQVQRPNPNPHVAKPLEPEKPSTNPNPQVTSPDSQVTSRDPNSEAAKSQPVRASTTTDLISLEGNKPELVRASTNPNSQVITPEPHFSTEAKAIFQLFLNWKLMCLTPMFFASNFFYTYQFNVVNGGGMFTTRTRGMNGVFYWTAQILGSFLMGKLLDSKNHNRSKRALFGLGLLFIATTVIWGGGYAFQLTFSRGYHGEKIDVVDARRYAGPVVLYATYGAFDALWQTYCYWIMGALSNETAPAARMAGFYKAVQNAGAACAGQVDAKRVAYQWEVAGNWVLLMVGVVFAVPVAMAVQDSLVVLEEDLEGDNVGGKDLF